jgi:hypothetical protein
MIAGFLISWLYLNACALDASSRSSFVGVWVVFFLAVINAVRR